MGKRRDRAELGGDRKMFSQGNYCLRKGTKILFDF